MIRHPEGGEAAKDLLSCHPDLVAGKALKLSGSLRAPFFEHRSLMKMRITAEKMYTKGAKYGTMYNDQAKTAEKACGSVKYTGKGSGAYAAARCGGGHRRGHRHA